MEYRVLNSRYGEAEEIFDTFKAEDDEAAKEAFERYKAMRSLSWDILKLQRIQRSKNSPLPIFTLIATNFGAVAEK